MRYTGRIRWYLRSAAIAALLNVLSPAPAAAQSFTLTVHLNGESSGTVTVAPTGNICGPPSTVCTFLVPARATVRLAANGAIPGLFSAGTGAAASCGLTTCSFLMIEPAEVTATFSTGNGPTATVSTNLAGPGTGSVAVDNSRCQNFDPVQFSACTTTYLLGSVVTLTAAPAAGNRFARFSSGTGGADACGFAAVCTFTLGGNATLTATFHAITALVLSPPQVNLIVGQ